MSQADVTAVRLDAPPCGPGVGSRPTVGADLFRMGMRRLAAGVSLITTVEEGQRHGLVATSVTSLSGEPPSLLVCINRSTSSYEPITRSGIFCVNLIAEGQDHVAAQFSSSKRRDERFGDGAWTTLATGAPVLEGALAAFDCRVDHSLDYGTHTIFIGLIESIWLYDAKVAPLLYVDGAFRTLAEPP